MMSKLIQFIWRLKGIELILRLFGLKSHGGLKGADKDIENNSSFRPEPYSLGNPIRGHLLLQGKCHLPGAKYTITDGDIWKLANTVKRDQDRLYDFSWLDDLSAVRNIESINFAQNWTFNWMHSTSIGDGIAWKPSIAGRRVVRLRHNESILLAVNVEERRDEYHSSLKGHSRYLSKQRIGRNDGLSGVEVLAGLVYAELAEGGNLVKAKEAFIRFGDLCNQIIAPEIGIASRNPQELHKITELMQWCSLLAFEAGINADENLVNAVNKSVSILRFLRHADGSLARFHSGGTPHGGQLDRVLAGTNLSYKPNQGLAMGFARLATGKTTLIVDAAAPNTGKNSYNAHASTLAFELVVGDNPIIVNCGPGDQFGKDARQTSSHSTIEVNDTSSSQMKSQVLQKPDPDGIIIVSPDEVRIEQLPGPNGNTIIISHNGYAALFGLTHMRRLDMNPQGDHIWGEDTLWAPQSEDRKVFANAVSIQKGKNINFKAHFHLHPDVQVKLENRRRANLELINGDKWMFELEGATDLSIEPSVYFDENLLTARETSQIVLNSGFSQGSAAQLRWALRQIETTTKSKS